jgi:hypothetical protein
VNQTTAERQNENFFLINKPVLPVGKPEYGVRDAATPIKLHDGGLCTHL